MVYITFFVRSTVSAKSSVENWRNYPKSALKRVFFAVFARMMFEKSDHKNFKNEYCALKMYLYWYIIVFSHYYQLLGSKKCSSQFYGISKKKKTVNFLQKVKNRKFASPYFRKNKFCLQNFFFNVFSSYRRHHSRNRTGWIGREGIFF